MSEDKNQIDIKDNHFDFNPEKMSSDSRILFLEQLIEKYKDKIRHATPHTDEMRMLVKQLISLRLKHVELKETSGEEFKDNTRQVMGHVFVEARWAERKAYCEVCCGLIIFYHTSFKCTCCAYCCHDYCINYIKRVCSFLKVQENPTYIMDICPEKGLHKQSYKCAECKEDIGFEPSMKEARMCDYTGQFYCTNCHWNDTMVIPARVVANWDFTYHKVSRPTKSFLKLMVVKPILNLECMNESLFKHCEDLIRVKLLRQEIILMKTYLTSCNSAKKERLMAVHLGHKSHFIDNYNNYSLQDLFQLQSDQLLLEVQKAHAAFLLHIKSSCETCREKGSVCSICLNEEPIHSFDSIVCEHCNANMHVLCFKTSGQVCPKCQSHKRGSG